MRSCILVLTSYRNQAVRQKFHVSISVQGRFDDLKVVIFVPTKSLTVIFNLKKSLTVILDIKKNRAVIFGLEKPLSLLQSSANESLSLREERKSARTRQSKRKIRENSCHKEAAVDNVVLEKCH